MISTSFMLDLTRRTEIELPNHLSFVIIAARKFHSCPVAAVIHAAIISATQQLEEQKHATQALRLPHHLRPPPPLSPFLQHPSSPRLRLPHRPPHDHHPQHLF